MKRASFFFVVLISFIIGISFAVFNRSGDVNMDIDVGFLYQPVKAMGEFSLIDSHAKTITEKDFQGKWGLIYFGFTHCPDACPVALSDMKKIKAKLPENINDKMQFVFVSVDPNRDTPERLNEYVPYFDKEFIGATGTDEQIKALTAKLAVAYAVPKVLPENNAYYNVDHSTFFLLFDDQLNITAMFRTPHNPNKIASVIADLMER